MRQRVRSVMVGMSFLSALSSGAQEPTTAALTWDQEAVSEIALELDGVLSTANFEAVGSGEQDANAAREAAHTERLAAEVAELAARLAVGEDREATRELMTRIQNRRAIIAGMDSAGPAVLSPEDAAEAAALWSELRAYYRPQAADTAAEVIE